jgi:RND family efflux transporter MFP subunit
MKRYLTLIIVLTLLPLSACKDKEPPPPVKPVKTIVVGGISGTGQRNFPGKVDAFQNLDLSFQVAGRIEELPIKEGQEFQTGDFMGKLDARDYEQDVAAQKAQHLKTKNDLERYRQLWTRDAVPLADLQEKERNFEVAEANLKVAEKALEETKIMAPFHGQVARKFVEVNEEVKAKQSIVNYLDLSQIKIIIDLPEEAVILAKSRDDDRFVATFASIADREFDLKVHEYGASADPATRTFPVTFVMEKPDDANVLPGMSATVKWEVPTGGQAVGGQFLIPVSGVFTDPEGQQSAWVVNEETMTVHQKVIGTESMMEDYVKVTSGLQLGDRIVTAGTHFLQEGMEVRLLEPTREQKNP